MPAAEHVEVEVEHGLSCVGTGVDHEPIAGFCDPFLTRNPRTGEHEMS